MRDMTLEGVTDPFLWVRVRGAMLPVDATGRSFANQLGETTGLTPAKALALEGEYRRFLYLAALSPAPREPLGLLRTAWEYHAAFDGYLLDFCPWILERHLPAVPVTKVTGPAFAAARIDYLAEFGTPPPAPFWPMPERRPDASAMRVPSPADTEADAPANAPANAPTGAPTGAPTDAPANAPTEAPANLSI